MVGLNVCMLLWEISQEFVTTNYYKDPDDLTVAKRFPSSLFLVLCNRAGAVIFSLLVCTAIGKSPILDDERTRQTGRGVAFLVAMLPALTNMMASWSQYSAMRYISFPLQTTAKSAKLLPVLIIGSFRGTDDPEKEVRSGPL